MNSIVKNLIISLVIALVAYVLLGFVQMGQIPDPTSSVGIASLFILFIAMVVRSLFGNGATSTSSSASTASGGDSETGTVKWFNVKKGYGFITRDQGDDVFVHYRNIQGSGRKVISDGQRVKFIVVDGDKGLQADEVETL